MTASIISRDFAYAAQDTLSDERAASSPSSSSAPARSVSPTALGLDFYGLPFLLFEDDAELSRDTKAGTILTRTLEALRRYGVADAGPCQGVARRRDRRHRARDQYRAAVGADGTARRRHALSRSSSTCPSITSSRSCAMPSIGARPGALHLRHRLTSFSSRPDDGVVAELRDARRQRDVRGALTCWPATAGAARCASSSASRSKALARTCVCLLVDVKVDLDVDNPRDYPYLAYFADPQEWMILVRQPHCWRFLYPLAAGFREPGADEFRDKVHRVSSAGRRDGDPQHHRLPHPPPRRDAMAAGSACS